MSLKKVGIIGGVGPYAGLDLSYKILENTIAETDNDHIPQVHISFPADVPDRTSYLMKQSDINPADSIINLIKKIIFFDINILAIACNQVHSPLIFNVIKEYLPINIKIVNMVEEVVKSIKETYSHHRNIGVLGRNGTYYTGIYKNEIIRNNLNFIDHSDIIQQMIDNSVAHPDYGIKKFSNPVKEKAINNLYQALNYHISLKTEVLIIGCTEIPLVIKSDEYKGMKLIDATTVMARAIVKMCNPNKLKPSYKNYFT